MTVSIIGDALFLHLRPLLRGNNFPIFESVRSAFQCHRSLKMLCFICTCNVRAVFKVVCCYLEVEIEAFFS